MFWMITARYAGVQPITAVASSISESGTSTRWLSSPNRLSSRAPASPSMAGSSGAWQITPRCTSVVIVGIARTTGVSGKSSRNRATGVAASTDAIASPAPPSCSAAASRPAGFIASTTASACRASSARDSTAVPPSCRASPAARPEPASAKNIASGPFSDPAQPRASAAAMFPAPAKPIFIERSLRSYRALGLVEEALLDEPGLLLGRHLDVAGRQQESLFGDLLHPAVERVGEAGREVDQPLRQLAVGGLKVEDHRDRALEAIGDLLGVIEAARRHQMDLDVGAAVAPHRLQHAAAR